MGEGGSDVRGGARATWGEGGSGEGKIFQNLGFFQKKILWVVEGDPVQDFEFFQKIFSKFFRGFPGDLVNLTCCK